jgi:hypothetical protein
MLKKCAPGVLLLMTAALLGGCEPTTGVQQPPRSIPDPRQVHSVTGLQPAELAALLAMAGPVEHASLSGEPWFPPAAHPLDGLTPDQVQRLFTAAGLPAERYAARWLHPCDPCTDPSSAR